jgi:uncharacterized damage-inducible protein DinB
MNRARLLKEMEKGREDFLKSLDGLSEDDLLAPNVTGLWSIKDILFHLTMWEAELVTLLWQASENQNPSTAHTSRETQDETNASWTRLGAGRPLAQVFEDFYNVRKQTIRRLNALRDADFENPSRYTWLRGRSLWEWVAEDTFRHDAEHAAQIRLWRVEKGY